jgi:hypothetical protein
MPTAMQLVRAHCWPAARQHLLLSQPPAWPLSVDEHRLTFCTAWYRVVSGYFHAPALQHGGESDGQARWMALLAQHRCIRYDTVLASLPCVVCGSADSHDGNVIVYCDKGRYCRGLLACHQMCILPQRYDTESVDLDRSGLPPHLVRSWARLWS